MLDVVHVSTSDIEGGSARSAWRIHQGLRRLGARSRMLVGWRSSDSPDVETVSGSRAVQWLDGNLNRLTQKAGFQYRLLASSPRLRRHRWVRRADVFQLYNLHGGYFDPDLLPDLSARAPLVWRLSDLWPLTGHCAYPGPCTRWLDGCGACPDLASYPPIGIDRTASIWRRRLRIYGQCDITVVAPSSWTEDAARRSPLFRDVPILRIPNGIDVDRFRPADRDAARARLGIDDRRPGILFSPHVAIDNPRKGTDLLERALRALPDPSAACLLVAGIGAEHWVGRTPLAAHPLGYLRDEAELADAYAASDLVTIPSAVENLPNSALEALAAGRPIVAVDAGGMKDAVRDGETGLLVSPGDPAALAAALDRLIGDPGLRARLGQAGRALAEAEFAQDVEAQRFFDLYGSLVEARA